MTIQGYDEFLRAKVPVPERCGFDVADAEINPILKPHERDMVRWAVSLGRAALFASFGLGKTVVQLEILRLLHRKTGLDCLNVLPLGVRQEFTRDAAMLASGENERITEDQRAELRQWRAQGDGRLMPVPQFIRRPEERDPDHWLYITNYETVRDGKLDPKLFGAVSLDEAAVLRSFGGTKTFRSLMNAFEGSGIYRFVATATPSPNAYVELLAYAGFLDVMDIGQAKTRFFQRDSQKADALTLYPHKEREFWLWVASWALFIYAPSDLGHSDEGYALPPMTVHWHEVASDHSQAGAERDGQGRMFRNAALGVTQAAGEKRDSLAARIDKMMEIINAGAGEQTKGLSPSLLSGTPGRNAREEPAREAGANRARPSLPSRLSRAAQDATFGGSTQAGSGSLSGEQAGVQAKDPQSAIESLRADRGGLSGDAFEAGRRLSDMRSDDGSAGDENQASCGSLPQIGDRARASLSEVQFGAGNVQGRSEPLGAGGGISTEQWVVWCDLNAEQRAIERALTVAALSFSSLYGSQDVEARESLLADWRDNKTDVFLTKPMMYGAGVNLQQCHKMLFVGVGFKFYQFIQAVHRVHRFLQSRPCEIHIIYTEAERDIRQSLEGKWTRHAELATMMRGIVKEYGLADAALSRIGRSFDAEPGHARGDNWRAIHGDCIDETAAMPANSVDLIVTSIPFATQYEYTPNYRDFGHTDDNGHFWRQMDFLSPELLRTLRPGRVMALHCKDRIVPGGLSGLGFQTLHPFHAEAIFHYQRHGFAFLGMKTITTDVVRENNQTYRLGWSEQCKDGTRMGVGVPEYLLLFRKPPSDAANGYADDPVTKDKPLVSDHGEPAPFDSRTNWKRPVPGTGYSRGRWQLDAHGYSRSSGDRLISHDELMNLPHEQLYKAWRERAGQVYSHAEHVALCEHLDAMQRLPATFMLFPPHSPHPDVWSDVARMRTLNGAQHAAGREMHLCPLQFDIVDRAITQFSMPGETVFDPFMGIGTVPYCALKLGRKGVGTELNEGYWRDAVFYLKQAEREANVPTLFDLLDAAGNEDAAASMPERLAAD